MQPCYTILTQNLTKGHGKNCVITPPISLGKEFAGRQVLIEEQEAGVWLIRTAMVIPENEFWLHQPSAKRDLEQALDWAKQNSPSQSNPVEVIRKLENAKKAKRKQS